MSGESVEELRSLVVSLALENQRLRLQLENERTCAEYWRGAAQARERDGSLKGAGV